MTDDLVTQDPTAQVPATADWKEKMRAKARAAVQTEASMVTGKFITTKGGILKYDKQPVAGNQLDCVVLDSIFENAYYANDFDPENPTSPDCYAYMHDDGTADADDLIRTMAPHPKAKTPQAASCAECQWNKFGTAKQGKGKACKNTRRLALVAADKASLEDLLKAETAYLKLPVTSVKEWAKHVRTCAGLYELPPFGLVSQVKAVPDEKSQFKLLWDVKAVLPEDLQQQAYRKAEAVLPELMAPYTEFDDEPATPPAREAVGKSGKKKY